MDDYQFVLNWSRNDLFCLANEWEINRSPEELYTWWLNCVNSENDSFIRMGIESNKKLVGYTDLSFIKDNTAELGVAIGESGLWGKGIGVIAALSMVKYGAEHLGITIFNAETHESNIRSRRMLEKIGFIEISRVGTEEYIGVDDKLIQYQFINSSNKSLD